MNYIRSILIFIHASCSIVLYAQEKPSSTLKLEEAYQLARNNYPLIKDAELINRIEEINLEAIKRGQLPQLSLNGNAQVQTENFELPAGETTLEAPLETWNTYLEMDFNLYDGGLTKAQKQIERSSSQVEHSSLEVQLRGLKDQVNTLLFAISLGRKQTEILKTSKDDLASNVATLQAGFENGTVLESEVSKLKVRQLELVSDIIATNADIETYFALLEQLIGQQLARDTEFVMPVGSVEQEYELQRPEQILYDEQKLLLDAQKASITANGMPKVSLFAQGGLGNPNPLNFADFSTAAYALGGVRLQWDFFDFGKRKKEKESLVVQQDQIEVDRELFLFDIESDVKEYKNEIGALQEQITNNEAIVGIQKDILDQSKVQLDNGVINSNDYVQQLNAYINAQQELELNKIQLQQSIINYLTLVGQL